MKYHHIIVECSICSKEFEVLIDKNNNKIITDCWHNTLDLNWFNGWTYGWKGNDIFNEKKKEIYFKNKWYKIIGYTKIQREIVYYLFKWFHRKELLELWECTGCCNREDD